MMRLADLDAPPAAVRLLEQVVEACRRRLAVRRIVLIGSTARGEATFGDVCGREELYSDLEAVVLTDGFATRQDRERLTADMQEIEDATGFLNPFFHLDIDVKPDWLFWPKLAIDWRISTYELSQNGVVLWGPPFDRSRYRFTPAQLDIGNTNELVLRRLWNQLLLLPNQLFEGEQTPYAWRMLELSLCRNLLDVLTIYLPHHAILLPSYRARLRAFVERPELVAMLGPDAEAIQRRALAGKCDLTLSGDVLPLYEAFLRQYLALLGLLSGRSTPPGSPTPETVAVVARGVRARSTQLFRGSALAELRVLRRELRIARRIRASCGVGRLLQWMRVDRRASMIECLLCLHLDAWRLLSGQRAAVLERADELLDALDPVSRDRAAAPDSPVQHWKALYRDFCRLMAQWKYNDPDALARWGAVTWRDPAPPDPEEAD